MRTCRLDVVATAGALGLIVLNACSTAALVPQQLHPRWIKNTGLPTALVFVHGMSGDGMSTWTNPTTEAYFPKLVAEDPQFHVDVYAYDYAAPLTGGSFRINEAAEEMRLVLARDRVPERRELVFIAHSLGGLVTRAYLLKNRPVAERVRFLYFFATPTTGSDIARVFSAFSSSPQLAEVGRISPSLADLIRDWLNAELEIPTYCGYERRPMFGAMVVDELSAMSQCTRRVDPIDANHVEIVKPADRRHSSYSALLVAFRDSEARPRKDGRVAQTQMPPAAPIVPTPPSQPSTQQRSTGPNSPNIIGDHNRVIINPDVNPRAPVVIYDFRGNRKEIRQGGTDVRAEIGGLNAVFDEMRKLAQEQKWRELRDLTEKQIKEHPEWLTPVLLSAIAHANLGDIDTAIQRTEDVQRRSAGDPAYSGADALRKEIRNRSGR